MGRADGRLLVGMTEEPEAGYHMATTARALAESSAAAIDLLPHVAGLHFGGAWVGPRPVNPDGCPLLGPSTRARGPPWATGHAGMGVLLAPTTAKVIVDLALGQRPSPLSETRLKD